MKIKGGCMERKVGEVFNDGNDVIEVVPGNGCGGCYYKRDSCVNSLRYDIAGVCCANRKSGDVKFIKIGETKMDKEELLKQIAEIEQREKENQKTLEEMRKKVEKLEQEQPTVSATGVVLEQVGDKNFFYLISAIGEINIHMITSQNTGKLYIDKGDAFETAEQAKQEVLRREGQEFIRRCAMLWNKDHDWRKKNEIEQYYIYFDLSGNKIDIGFSAVTTKGHICFDTYELVERCIAELKNKYNYEQLKTIFGVK